MEGNVYPCTWKKTRDGYRLSLKRKPSINASGPSFEAASEALREQVVAKLGDGESCFEFDRSPPQHSLPKSFLTPELVTLAPAACAYARRCSKIMEVELQTGLYSGGYCNSCRRALGQRTSQPATFANLWSHDAQIGMVGGRNPLFSEAFLALLSPTELKRCDFLEIERRDHGRKRFFELTGKSVAPFVGSKILDRLPKLPAFAKVEKCGECGWCFFNYFFADIGLVRLVAAGDLPQRIPTCFVVGAPPDLSLCMTVRRWRSLMGRRGTRGITSIPLGIVRNQRDVIRLNR